MAPPECAGLGNADYTFLDTVSMQKYCAGSAFRSFSRAMARQVVTDRWVISAARTSGASEPRARSGAKGPRPSTSSGRGEPVEPRERARRGVRGAKALRREGASQWAGGYAADSSRSRKKF